MTLVRFNLPEVASWRALRGLPGFTNELDRLLEAPFSPFARVSRLAHGWIPVDLHENENAFVVTAEIPGLKVEDITVSVEEDTLTLSGERKPEVRADESAIHRAERFVGKFERSVQLAKPVDAAKVTASYKDGILTVTLPIAEAAKPKQIKIEVN